MSRICWQTQDEKKLRENKGGQSSNLVNATHSASAASTLKFWINCSIFTSISNFYISIKSFNSRSISINQEYILKLCDIDFLLIFMITWKFRKVDMRLILWITWISSNTLFLSTVNSIPSIASGDVSSLLLTVYFRSWSIQFSR